MFKNTNIMIGGLLFIFSLMAHSGSDVSLSDSNIKSKKGETVSVDLIMSDFSMTEGGGVNMKFDPELVQVNSIDIDESVWNFVNKVGEINNTDGTVTDILFSNYKGVSGNVKIATLELLFVGKGKGKIVLSESANNPFASGGEKLSVTYKRTTIRVRR